MTIQGLWEYINDKHHACRRLIPRDSFRGYRVSVDAMGVFFRLRMRVRKTLAKKADVINGPLSEEELDRLWLVQIYVFISELLMSGITPILVFEKGLPPLKEAKRGQRESEKNKKQTKADTLRDKLLLCDRFSINASDLSDLRNVEGSIPILTSESKRKAFNFVASLGIPTIMCKEGIEAERVASLLTIIGVSAATYSPDGDCLAHRSPVVIRGEGAPITIGNHQIPSFEIIYLEAVLMSMNIKYEQFREVCIMAGCDYNKNVPKYGFARSFDLIQRYQYIECIPHTAFKYHKSFSMADIDALRFKDCREEFSPPPGGTESLIDFDDMPEDSKDFGCTIISAQIKPFSESVTQVLYSHSLQRYEDRVKNLLAMCPIARCFDHSKDRLNGTTTFIKTAPKSR